MKKHARGAAAPGGPESPAVPARLRRLAYLLDDVIPLPGGRRVGLDPLIGLIPGVGDATGALMSAYIMVEASRLGAPRSVLLRMLANVGVEALVGTIPFLGDLFDAGWKANARNVRLLDEHLARPAAARRSSRGFLLLLLLAVLLIFAGSAAVTFLLLRGLFSALGG